MLIYTILKSAETQLPRLRLRRFKVFASIVCRAVCHAWLTVFHGRHNIDTLTAGAVARGDVWGLSVYINGCDVWVRLSTATRHKYHVYGGGCGAAWFATIADVKRYLKNLAV